MLIMLTHSIHLLGMMTLVEIPLMFADNIQILKGSLIIIICLHVSQLQVPPFILHLRLLITKVRLEIEPMQGCRLSPLQMDSNQWV